MKLNNIFLFDYTHVPAAPSDWGKVILALGVDPTHVCDDNEPPITHIAYEGRNVIFCHSNGCEEQWRTLVRANTIQGDLVFVRSGGEQPPEKEERMHGCYWKPAEFRAGSNNESVRQFITDLQSGVFRSELLQPRAVPKPVLAYALAVHFRYLGPKVESLREAADRAYEELRTQGLSLLQKRRAISFPKVGLPSRNEFQSQPPTQAETESRRFQAMRNLIDVLREDL